MGIGAAYTDGAQVDQVKQRVSEVLLAAGLPDYVEATSPDDQKARHAQLDELTRSDQDAIHAQSTRMLSRMIMRARGSQAGPFADIALAVERVFVPGDFPQRLDAPRLPGRSLWSTGGLLTALRGAALTLGMPLSNNDVPEKVIKLVNLGKKLGKGDLASEDPDEHGFTMMGDYRRRWLTMWEYTRLAHEHKLALVLA